ncbi:NAD(P)-dependent oxidoreductase [soil metagenome]
MNQLGEGRRILVVGGAGYVGNVLVRRLLDLGCQVHVLDRLLFDQGTALSGLVEHPLFSFQLGDLCDESEVESALDGVTDVVILAALVGDPIAGKYPDLARRINDGCKKVLELAEKRGVGRLVFTSTCSNYGLRDTSEPADETSDLAPVSLYAELKVDFERYVLSRSEDLSLCPVLLRIATAYGLSQRMRFDLTISEFTQTLATGQELVVYDADTWRPYCHVDDISGAIITALESEEEKVRGEVFNVGHSDENYTKRMVVDVVQDAIGGVGKVTFEEGGRDPRNYRVSFEKIHQQLGFEPRHRVPETVATLVAAIQARVFDDFDSRPGFFTNHSVVIPGEDSRADG